MFGVWEGDKLLLIGKVYLGFIDDELKKFDNWIRWYVIGWFGLVCEVEKVLVLEVVFDVVYLLICYKFGVVFCFFCVYCICWDKFVSEVDILDVVKWLIWWCWFCLYVYMVWVFCDVIECFGDLIS